jgi:hypothetical protein
LYIIEFSIPWYQGVLGGGFGLTWVFIKIKINKNSVFIIVTP